MYVVLEGIDTTGKSTQIELLKSRYKNAIFTKEPSDSELGNLIRELALYEDLDNTTQALLFMIDRAKHTQEIIYPNKDKLIISDRSFISGIAYCDDIDFDMLCKLNLSIACIPDLVVILETNKEILSSRLKDKALDRIESIGIDSLLDIQDRIFSVVKKLNINHIAIRCDMDKNEILRIICSTIKRLQNEMHTMPESKL